MVNESSALKKSSTAMQSYSAAVDKSLERNVSNSSVISDRRYSTARLFGIMVPKNFGQTILWAALSILTSTGGVLANNKLFKSYKFPLIVAQVIQMMCQIIISMILGLICHDGKSDPKQAFWPRFTYNWRTGIYVFPVAVAYIFRILSTNGAIGETPVSTYQVLRQGAIVFSVLFSALILGMWPTWLVVISCFIIVGGVVVTSFDPSSLSLTAVLWGLFAGICSAMYLVIIKYYLPVVDQDSRVLVNYNSAGSMFLLLPMMFITGHFQRSLAYLPWTKEVPVIAPGVEFSYTRVWIFVMLSGVTSFCINIVSTLLVKVSSPVTYDVIGVVKSVLQAVYGIFVNKEPAKLSSIAGISLSIIGSFAYGKAKHLEHVHKVKNDAADKKRISMEKRMVNKSSGTLVSK